MYYLRIEIAMVQFYYGLSNEPVKSIDDAWTWYEFQIVDVFRQGCEKRPENKRRCVQSLCAL